MAAHRRRSTSSKSTARRSGGDQNLGAKHGRRTSRSQSLGSSHLARNRIEFAPNSPPCPTRGCLDLRRYSIWRHSESSRTGRPSKAGPIDAACGCSRHVRQSTANHPPGVRTRRGVGHAARLVRRPSPLHGGARDCRHWKVNTCGPLVEATHGERPAPFGVLVHLSAVGPRPWSSDQPPASLWYRRVARPLPHH